MLLPQILDNVYKLLRSDLDSNCETVLASTDLDLSIEYLIKQKEERLDEPAFELDFIRTKGIHH
jgi:hypothetical protein